MVICSNGYIDWFAHLCVYSRTDIKACIHTNILTSSAAQVMLQNLPDASTTMLIVTVRQTQVCVHTLNLVCVVMHTFLHLCMCVCLYVYTHACVHACLAIFRLTRSYLRSFRGIATPPSSAFTCRCSSPHPCCQAWIGWCIVFWGLAYLLARRLAARQKLAINEPLVGNGEHDSDVIA
jgi:hypothetical protein